MAVANQVYNRFKAAGKALNEGDIAIVDAAEYHHYQVRAQLRGAQFMYSCILIIIARMVRA